jgi:hypothetical protein
MNPDRQVHDCPAACVIAQQYSFATFASLRFISLKGKFGAVLNSSFFPHYQYCKSCVSLKLPVSREVSALVTL